MTPLLSVRDLTVEYPVKGLRKPPARILNGVSIDIRPGETVGLVGESGSGKTTLGRAVLGLAPVTGGSIQFRGEDIVPLRAKARRAIAPDIQVVFQDPYTSLNPSLTIGQILSEPLTANGMRRREADDRINELLHAVDLPSNSTERFPREFSGGQRQRVAIARALALRPSLIICDEPVSALDLTTQQRVLDLFLDIQARTGVAYLFISHDLTVVRHVSHRVAVLFRGDIVEWGSCDEVTDHPQNPYTQRLLLASPLPDPRRQAERRQARTDAAALPNLAPNE
ncbi:ATP-binding cassette domain-containing protein [Microbacterium phyllosphaerae]|uniref:ATP-binding cassette domain-containing protein n=1 Tax=Microbacterium phyllosphaerae TaxID=124798 RepID=UPI000EA0123F|nr:ATP-binding cassette domain-containing protein [Microbacterium phyllosphaerae]